MPAPHKPLFLLTGLWACLPPLVWLWPAVLPDPVFWHLHELFFGMAGAAIGGYLLTALPHWTRQRIGPKALWLLVIAWLVGRGAQLSDELPTAVVIVAALAYPLALTANVLLPLLQARVWHKAWMVALPFGLGTADVALLLAHRQDFLPGIAPPLLVLTFALMIGLVGGRIVPAFTQSRLAQLGAAKPPQSGRILGYLAAAATGLAISWLAIDGAPTWAGGALLLAGALQILRLIGWQTWAIKAHPDIAMLHLAWVWLAAGTGLVGAAAIWPQTLTVSASLHALTMGAMGSMIFAVAARPFMGRQPGRLVVSADLAAGFALISAAATLRVFFPDRELLGLDGLHGATLCWSGAWALFIGRILHDWSRPVPFPILSANLNRRAQNPSPVDR